MYNALFSYADMKQIHDHPERESWGLRNQVLRRVRQSSFIRIAGRNQIQPDYGASIGILFRLQDKDLFAHHCSALLLDMHRPDVFRCQTGQYLLSRCNKRAVVQQTGNG